MLKKIFSKRKIAIMLAAFVVVIIIYCLLGEGEDSAEFTFDQIQKGDLLNSISCTGTLEPVGSVDVGTELSGTVSQTFADYNDDVAKGQILAILDTTLLSINLRSALADQIKAESDFRLNKLQYRTDQKLYKQGVISELELITSEKNFKTAKATLITAQTNVEKIRLNIDKYSIIRSPIDGKVIDRSIEAGQTVAASLSSPTLFCIAENLENMEIYASVDESDIGQVQKGLVATFTVEAYPEQTFTGTVKQIRLQPETVSNVVNYTVIVEAKNDSGLLLPGMTATIEFIIEEKKDAFYVNSSALEFIPTLEHARGKKKGKRPEKRTEAPPAKPQEVKEEGENKIWYFDEDEKLKSITVEAGMTYGTKIEIYGSDQLKEGLEVIIKQKNASATANNNSKTHDNRGSRPLF